MEEIEIWKDIPGSDLVINHKNEIKSDNNLENLEISTNSYNKKFKELHND